MAGIAPRRYPLENAAYVTALAVRRAVHTGERKASGKVVERLLSPGAVDAHKKHHQQRCHFYEQHCDGASSRGPVVVTWPGPGRRCCLYDGVHGVVLSGQSLLR